MKTKLVKQIKKLRKEIKSQIILNPVENLPYKTVPVDTRLFSGLYVSDKNKTINEEFNSIIAFSGRRDINLLVQEIYKKWAYALHAKNISLRFLSGLHAHTTLFMSIGKIGDTVALLPEIAGGHYATKNILLRLGYNVIELIPDLDNYKLNIPASIELINKSNVDFLFIDRSEGIFYEDFTELCNNIKCYKIFDASQYLAHIIFEDYKSPFTMGFDMILSTLHKNFPGPQKALVCSKEDDIVWYNLKKGTSNYVSSLHIESVLQAGVALEVIYQNKEYSKKMLENSIIMRTFFMENQVPVVENNLSPKTQHIWIKCKSPEEAFKLYKNLESCGILVNYRKLPYNLGYGLRIGTAASTLCGLNQKKSLCLAKIITEIYFKGVNKNLKKEVRKIVKKLY